jgi:RNA polymerase sigma-54 factor
MKQGLSFGQSQQLALTPQLQQSIRLLQLSAQELNQEIAQKLLDNPLLECEDDFELSLDSADEDDEASEASSESEMDAWEQLNQPSAAGEAALDIDASWRDDEMAPHEVNELKVQADSADSAELQDEYGLNQVTDEFASSSGVNTERSDQHETKPQGQGLGSLEHMLKEQVLSLRLKASEKAALLYLIDSLDERGYLADELEDLANAVSGESSGSLFEQSLQALRLAHRYLLSFEPVGVGARHLSEALVAQLKVKKWPLTQTAARDLALGICELQSKDSSQVSEGAGLGSWGLVLLAKRDFKTLNKHLSKLHPGLKSEDLEPALKLIQSLEPHPARAYGKNDTHNVIPDVRAVRKGQHWRAELNGSLLPRLKIQQAYADALRQHKKDTAGAVQSMQDCLQEARWFIKSVQQRFDTLLRVSDLIVQRQAAYFRLGSAALKPMVIREIADELGLHESTISRVTTAKYMSTPWGTVELKYFFSSGLQTLSGADTSSTAVRGIIAQIIAAENPSKPLSDQKIADLLKKQGIACARRTVAKYRESLHISPKQLRKNH